MWHLIRVRRIAIILAACLCLAVLTAHAAHTQARLILGASTARPGDTIWAGVDLKMEPAWHTYWKNPGAAGIATKIEWQLPPGVTAGEIQWPLPEKLPPAEVTTYGYNDEVVLLVPLKLAADLKPGPLNLKAKISWLECKEACIPGSGSVEATLYIGTETKPSADTALIESWRGKVPKPGDHLTARTWWEKPANGDTRPLILEWPTSNTLHVNESADFFPDANDNFEIQAATEDVSNFGIIKLRRTVKKFSGDWPKQISGVVILQSGLLCQSFEVKLPVSDQAPAGETISAQTPPESSTGVPPVRAGETPALPLQPL
jgi:thiol:disulfide interchange protein DsbD